MCKLLQRSNLGLDVVSYGELYTAKLANFDPSLIYFHGNNKLPVEISFALDYGPINFIVDNESELNLIIEICKQKARH